MFLPLFIFSLFLFRRTFSAFYLINILQTSIASRQYVVFSFIVLHRFLFWSICKAVFRDFLGLFTNVCITKFRLVLLSPSLLFFFQSVIINLHRIVIFLATNQTTLSLLCLQSLSSQVYWLAFRTVFLLWFLFVCPFYFLMRCCFMLMLFFFIFFAVFCIQSIIRCFGRAMSCDCSLFWIMAL